MCGITALIDSTGATDAVTLIGRMTTALAHRGPDDHGFWGWDGRGRPRTSRDTGPLAGSSVCLGHRRLSIIDLSETGHQPMSSHDGRLHIVFNGEIYNYVELRQELIALGHEFRSTSDTEVLLTAWCVWGQATLARLIGMFAFALVDLDARTMTLARDQFGIKPLYYVLHNGVLAAASEIKALWQLPGLPRRANPARLYHYLRSGWTDFGNETLLHDVHQLMPGHVVTLAIDRPLLVTPTCYWRLSPCERPDRSLTENAAELRRLFLDSVRLHLRSDVPIGSALSGGIDSSAIVAAIHHIEPNQEIHALSFVPPDPDLSEEKWIDLVGSHTAAHVHKTSPTEQDLVNDLDHLVRTHDEPFGSTSIYAQYSVFRLARARGIKVMLDGQGADELFAGYRPYLGHRLASLLQLRQFANALRLIRNARRLPGSDPTLCHTALGKNVPAQLKRLLRPKPSIPPWLDIRWFVERNVSQDAVPSSVPESGPGHALRDELQRTLTLTSLPMLLRFEDRNSMAHSIESRVPFLTPAMAEFALSLPEEHLLSLHAQSKAVLRQALHGIVPAAILQRRDKIGFATPERRWLGAVQPWVDRILTAEAAQRLPALNLPYVSQRWHDIKAGRQPWSSEVWWWLNCLRWIELCNVDCG